MGICDWFKRITGNRRKKENTPKKSKMQEDCKNSRGSKGRYSMAEGSNFVTSNKEVTSRHTGTKEFAATRIQTAFRAYKARKTLRYLKGVLRFQALIDKDALTNQASTALERSHFRSKIQAEISARRLCMATKGRIKQMKLEHQLKLESKLRELEVEHCGGCETMEATNKRERALAYAFSHQWRANSSRYFGQAYYDLSKESWGWSWTKGWIAIYRWEAHVVARPVISMRTGLRNKPHGSAKMENREGTTKAGNCTSSTATEIQTS